MKRDGFSVGFGRRTDDRDVDWLPAQGIADTFSGTANPKLREVLAPKDNQGSIGRDVAGGDEFEVDLAYQLQLHRRAAFDLDLGRPINLRTAGLLDGDEQVTRE